MTQTIIALLATATLSLSGPPTIATGATTSDNTVTITSSDLDAEPAYYSDAVNSVTIRFRNTGDVAAREVVFVVQAAGHIPAVIDDVGNYPKGGYVHTFYNLGDVYGGTVTLRAVRYVDGSEWTAPVPRSRRQAGAAASY
jgi:hypothetical protein